MGLKAGLQILQQTGKAVADYADDAVRIATQSCDDIAKYAKACGKRSILETKPSIFHGINPTISYPPSGKVYELPRFCTQEMQQARKLNQIAIRQIKQPINTSFPKATADDLRRLTSETVEDSFSRVQWTNPKDGKVYNLLKQGETADGKSLIRILDSEGGFVKEATLKPKRIVMIDANTECCPFKLEDISHGGIVYKYLRRNNPFAKIDHINVTGLEKVYRGPFLVGERNGIDAKLLAQELKGLTARIKKGELFDYITVSIGCEKKANIALQLLPDDKQALDALKELTAVSKGKTRILFSAGNDGNSMINSYLTAETVEGVGALGNTGKLTGFSASRNSRYTQHYEQGIFKIKETECGLNITGLPGTDLPNPYNMSMQGMKRELSEMKLEYSMIRGKRLRARKLYESLEAENGHRDMVRKIYDKIFDKEEVLEQNIKNLSKSIDRVNEYSGREIGGTSFSTPIRTAKLALNDMMEGLL